MRHAPQAVSRLVQPPRAPPQETARESHGSARHWRGAATFAARSVIETSMLFMIASCLNLFAGLNWGAREPRRDALRAGVAPNR